MNVMRNSKTLLLLCVFHASKPNEMREPSRRALCSPAGAFAKSICTTVCTDRRERVTDVKDDTFGRAERGRGDTSPERRPVRPKAIKSPMYARRSRSGEEEKMIKMCIA